MSISTLSYPADLLRLADLLAVQEYLGADNVVASGLVNGVHFKRACNRDSAVKAIWLGTTGMVFRMRLLFSLIISHDTASLSQLTIKQDRSVFLN
jgi:predicted tellurium resistance membrane protein TerC